MVAHHGVINTGSEVADSIITVLLSTSILVGGLIGCILDNLIPGKIMTVQVTFPAFGWI